MAKKSKKQLNAEFIKKIKSITVGSGTIVNMLCDSCGQPLNEHELTLVAISGILKIPKKVTSEHNPEHRHNEEVFFAE